MKLYSRIVILLCLFINCFSFNVFASVIEKSCDQNIYIIDGNRMFTSEEQARFNLDALEATIEVLLSGEPENLEKMKFELAYNNKVSLLRDFQEVYEQYSTHRASKFWSMLAGLEIMPDYLKEKLSARAESIVESSLEGNKIVQ